MLMQEFTHWTARERWCQQLAGGGLGGMLSRKRRNVGVLNCLLPEKHVINYHALIVVMPGAHNPGNAPNF